MYQIYQISILQPSINQLAIFNGYWQASAAEHELHCSISRTFISVSTESNEEVLTIVRDLIASYTDPSKSTAEGNGLQEAEIGAETDFNVTTRDSEGSWFIMKKTK